MRKIALIFLSTLIVYSFSAFRHNFEPFTDSKINFTIDGMFGIDVHGTISDLKTEINFFPEDPEHSSITAQISPVTVNTHNKKRDKHLCGPDFFDAEKFPVISFRSNHFRKIGEYFVVEGILTLKDIAKPIQVPFEFSQNGDSALFTGDFNINRLDYGIGKKSILMGNEVRIHLNIPVIKK